MSQKKPWGEMISISIYVEGDAPRGSKKAREPVFEAVEAAADAIEKAGGVIAFAGVSIEKVREEPIDQIAS